MANKRLQSTILEAVEEQLSGGECPFVAEAYAELVERGFTRKQAKEKIAEVLLEQMYGILQDKKEYDETSYRRGLEEMLEDTFPAEDGEDSEQGIWLGVGALLDKGYAAYEKHKFTECLQSWNPVWVILKENVSHAEFKMELYEVDEATDFEFDFAEWLSNYVTAYIAARRCEEAIQICQEVKQLFAWEKTAATEFNRMIGQAYDIMGNEEVCNAWFEKWLAEEPDNFDTVQECARYFWVRGQKERAEELLENALVGVECNYETMDDFMRAASFFRTIENEEKAAYYNDIYEDYFHKFLKEPVKYGPQNQEEEWFGWEDEPFYIGQVDYPQQPVVKEKKIYPNDPCPCGSGKKYKKCCGKN